jgi:hypothetical protein
MKPVKELKPNKFKAYDPFQRASYTFQGGDRVLKDIIIFKKSAK